jgi:hypothetical protein
MIRPSKKIGLKGERKIDTSAKNDKGQDMAEHVASRFHLPIRLPPSTTRQAKGGEDNITPRTKLPFNLPGGQDKPVQEKWANMNPFTALNEENGCFGFLQKN